MANTRSAQPSPCQAGGRAPVSPHLIAARRAFRLDGYLTLADVGMDGDYVSPLQISSASPTGPVLLAYHWLDAKSVQDNRHRLPGPGYLPGIPFNRVVDRALELCGMTRAGVYMTQVFHLLPPMGRSSYVLASDLDRSFQAVTRHELVGRRVIALGTAAAATCRRNGVEPDQEVNHPSARGLGRTIEGKADELANAIQAVAE